MTSKREAKKVINKLGTDLSTKAMLIGTLAGVESDAIDALVAQVLDMQMQALSHLNVSFDRTPAEFENGHAYRTARRAYYARVYKAIRTDLDTQIQGFVNQLNAAIPADFRESMKGIVAKR